MSDHLNALNVRLSNERARLASAKTEGERELRKAFVAQIEKEVADEMARVGVVAATDDVITDDELLAELMA